MIAQADGAIRLAMRAVEMLETADERLGGDVGFVRDGYFVLASADDAHANREGRQSR